MIAHESDTEPRITQSKDTRHLTNATTELVQKLSTCKRGERHRAAHHTKQGHTPPHQCY